MAGKVRIGILGCAAIAEKYSINAFKFIDNAELICVASRNPKKAEECAKRHGISAEKSYDAVLQRTDIDAVYIPLPVGLHEEWVIKAASAGKHVLCEKSLTGSFSSAVKMIEACKSNGVALYENFMCGFHPQHAKVLSLIHEGEIGEPFVFKGYFGFPPLDKKNFRYDKKLGGGSLNDAGSYTLFMARKMLEGEPVAVTANLVIDSETGVDVQGSAYVEFPNNKVAFCSFGFNQVYQNNYTVWGEKGLVRVNRAYSIPANLEPPVEILHNETAKDVITSVKVQAANHFEIIFRDFCNTVLSKNIQKISDVYKNILAQAKLMEAVRLSAAENRKVYLKEFADV